MKKSSVLWQSIVWANLSILGPFFRHIGLKIQQFAFGKKLLPHQGGCAEMLVLGEVEGREGNLGHRVLQVIWREQFLKNHIDRRGLLHGLLVTPNRDLHPLQDDNIEIVPVLLQQFMTGLGIRHIFLPVRNLLSHSLSRYCAEEGLE